MKLGEYFDKHQIRYSPWAKEQDIPPSTICRHLKKGNGFFLVTSLKIVAACGGEVDLYDLLTAKEKASLSPELTAWLLTDTDNGNRHSISVPEKRGEDKPKNKPLKSQGLFFFLQRLLAREG